ncbi:MAG: hypothetical protein OXQ31_14145 [Spirochaetaceae bacterium]|nr:hypothetical protein [Spirochaetaceae bacterium]
MRPPPVHRSARVSAVQARLERLGAVWDTREGAVREGALRPVHFGDPEAEAAIAPVLALADRGTIPRIGLKGPDALGWARAQGISVPDEIYGWTRAAGGGLSVRVGSGELFLEGPHADAAEEGLAEAPSGTACWPVRREDAAFLLCGERALEVLAQACSYDFRSAAGTFVMTRVAMVSCSILVEGGLAEVDGEEDAAGGPVYHLWAAASYGLYLWDELLAIVRDCGGGPVGDAALVAVLPAR